MNVEQLLKEEIKKAFRNLFDTEMALDQVNLQPTRKEFDGSHTFVCFPFAKISKKNPEETGKMIGAYLSEHSDAVKSYNVVKGFLNITLTDKVWISVFKAIWNAENYGFLPPSGKEVMVEYSSPNTNKPLHLGHLRNNFLGYAVSEILKANGHKVQKVQIINDRGIHICKSMLAWQKFGNGETPESTGLKGDKLVGNYYVRFDREYKAEVAELAKKYAQEEEAANLDPQTLKKEIDRKNKEGEPLTETEKEQLKLAKPLLEKAEKNAPILLEAQALLKRWEAKDPEVYQLWMQMNAWVYEGFEDTYTQMGVNFDKLYYESDTFLLGKDEVLKGLDAGTFFRKDDGSVWVDLSEEKLDEKLLLRSDGTSVYMTQDIGTAILRFRDFPNIAQQIYTVGNEQDHHFKVLFAILKKLGYAWAEECFHLSYGMVDLPSGKMKSREGTVVDADDLMQEMRNTAAERTQELGKIEGFTEQQATELYDTLGMGALKYFLLKVDPKKRMMFDPEESIQFQGNTAPSIQYTHARIASILRKAKQLGLVMEEDDLKDIDKLEEVESDIIYTLNDYVHKLKEAAKEYSPAVIAQYTYELAKSYNRFFQEVPIFKESDEAKLKFRIAFSSVVGETISKAMGLLGIKVPDRM